MKSYKKQGVFYSSLVHLVAFGGFFFGQLFGVFDNYYREERGIESTRREIISGFSELRSADFYLEKKESGYFDVYNVLREAIKESEKRTEKENKKSLEELVEVAEGFREDNLRRATESVQKSLNLEVGEYLLVNEVDVFPDIDEVVPYYRIIEREDKKYFQEILVDKRGNYFIHLEKLKEEMSDEDKRNYRIFEMTENNPAIREIRNTALEIISRILKD